MLDDNIRDVRLEAEKPIAPLSLQGVIDDIRRRLDRGIAEYIASQESNSDRPEGHANLGGFYSSLRRAHDAETEFQKALVLDSTFAPAGIGLADLYRATGREAEAGEVLRSLAMRILDSAAVRLALGFWLAMNGHGGEVLAELRRAMELAPDNPWFAYVYAVALSSRGDRKDAMDMLRQVLGRFPYDRDSLLAMASFARAAGDLETARLRRTARAARARQPQHRQAGQRTAPLAGARRVACLQGSACPCTWHHAVGHDRSGAGFRAAHPQLKGA
jgi:tetratricopeptide (TPR) repeat protein